MLTVRLLGPLAVDGTAAIEFPTRKTAMLFALLAFNPGKTVRRDAVRNLLWSDRGDAQSSGSLRRALSDIRRLLECHDAGDALWTSATELRLEADAVEVDVDEFASLLTDGGEDALARAALIYRGDLLSDVKAADAAFDDWLRIERQSLRNAAERLAEKLSEIAGSEPAFDAAERLALQLLRADEACEAAHRAIIRTLIRRGRHNAAIKQYASCVDAVREHLGAEPEDETKGLFDEARRHTRKSQANGASDGDARETIAAEAEDATFAPKPRIAILQFDSLSVDADQDHVAIGITEDLIVELSKISDYHVFSRQSALLAGHDGGCLAALHAELGATYVILGSVRRAESRIRVNARLVDPRSGQQLWANRYDRDIDDIFELLDDISGEIIDTIDAQIRVHQRERLPRLHPDNLDACEQFQRGMQHAYRLTRDEVDKAEAYFRRAIELAPDFASPHAGLAYVHLARVALNLTNDVAGEMAQSIRLAQRAISLQPSDAFPVMVLGGAMAFGADHETGLELLERAVAETPSHAQAYLSLGQIQAVLGQHDEAVQHIDKALSLCRQDLAAGGDASAAIRYDGPDTANPAATRPSAADIWPRMALAAALVKLGRMDQATKLKTGGRQAAKRDGRSKAKPIATGARSRGPARTIEDLARLSQTLHGLRRAQASDPPGAGRKA